MDRLGDRVEKVVKIILPKTAEKKCPACRRRKEWLNNFGANFS